MPEQAPADHQVHLPPERQRELTNLAGRLSYRFKDLTRLDQALRHSSFAHENPEVGPSNEQMEFLGDAVLALTVSNLLLEHFPASSEGELSRGRAALVNARRLATLARDLDLGAYLLLGRGEEAQAGREKPSLLADALEAVMAAVFLDGGLNAADHLTRRWFTPLLAGLGESPWQDFKTRLQELIQARHQGSPTYNVLSESGPSHARVFEVEVCLGERHLARGQGRTKKQAEQLAARVALEALVEELPRNAE
jgi:ribonuclease III